jgi:hypothetical protein
MAHQHQIEHFRGGRVLFNEQVLLEDVAGELSCRQKTNGRREWHGFMEVPNHVHIAAGAHLKLELNDGRSAEINAADIPGSEVAGRETHPVEFYVCGDLAAPRVRGLSGTNHRPISR